MATEPDRNLLSWTRSWLAGDVLEVDCLRVEADRRATPQHTTRFQLIVQKLAANVERSTERRVFICIPADRHAHHKASLRERLQRRSLLGQQRRGSQWRDQNRGNQP